MDAPTILVLHRRIIHYGPPKAFEVYYQQIGQAGRDGLEAYCTMYCNSGDFDKYKDDFYLGGLSASARSNQESSIDSLRRFAMKNEVCRRAELLKFFHEEPSFGERCGTCDTCQTRSAHSNDIERDFSFRGARLVLYTISMLNEKQGISSIEKVLRGIKMVPYRYKNSSVVQDAVHKKVIEMKSQMVGNKKRVPVSYFTKELLPALVERGYVQTLAQSATIASGRRTVSLRFLPSQSCTS
jgi:superfamily II DNA helicase RecQ